MSFLKTYFSDIIDGIRSLLTGMRLTGRYFVQHKKETITEQYPDNRATLKLAEMPRNSSAVRLHNRCQLTGRPHAYYRKLKLSRIMLRDLASFGQIPGMVKSSW